MRSARVAFTFLLLSAAAAAQQYIISTYAGGAPPPTPVLAVDVSIGSLRSLAADAAGNVYFTSENCVFKLDQNGVVARVAGKCRPGYSGDGGPATSAQLHASVGALAVAVDRAGNLFVADFGNHRIRKVSTSGIITTIAGTGAGGFSGDGGPATSAALYGPIGVAVDDAGNLFVADFGNYRVRKISPSGIITTVAGGGAAGLGDGGPATSAQLSQPTGVAVDGMGNLYITTFDSGGAPGAQNRIRRVSPNGIITTMAEVGGLAMALDGAGNLFIAEGGRIRKVSPSGIITTAADVGGFAVAVDGAGNLFIAEGAFGGASRIRKVSPDGTVTTVAGDGTLHSFSGDGGPATSAQLNSPRGVAVDDAGNLFIADTSNHRIRRVSSSGIITTVAGTGTNGFSGDSGPAPSAQLNSPNGVAVDGAGNLFMADSGNFRIRKVSPAGIITTVAGNGTGGSSGDGGPATSAQLSFPLGVAVDGAGNLFFSDGNRIRQISPNGIITTLAGSGAVGFSGDGGPATSAALAVPTGVAVDGAGNLFFADSINDRIRKVPPSGIITTVAGGPATGGRLYEMTAVALDGVGNLFIASSNEYFSNERIHQVSPSGIITTVAGTGPGGLSGDGGPATTAQLAGPAGVAVDGAGNIYVADLGNNVVRILRPTDRSALISAVVDAASERPDPVSPGKIVVLYGGGLGPSELVQNQPRDGQFGTELAGTRVSFNGIAAPVLYTSATQVAAIGPYALTGTTAQVTVTYQGQVSNTFSVPVAPSAPGLFTLNQTGAGQAAAINADGTPNTAANPVKIGGFISLYATGEGQTVPAGLDGRLAGSSPARPVLPVTATVGGVRATIQYVGSAPGQVVGLMQVNVQIPSGVQPGGYVPVVLQVGDRSSSPAVWIAVAN